jgi:hypothetical protein
MCLMAALLSRAHRAASLLGFEQSPTVARAQPALLAPAPLGWRGRPYAKVTVRKNCKLSLTLILHQVPSAPLHHRGAYGGWWVVCLFCEPRSVLGACRLLLERHCHPAVS